MPITCVQCGQAKQPKDFSKSQLRRRKFKCLQCTTTLDAFCATPKEGYMTAEQFRKLDLPTIDDFDDF
eukprot:g61627.t1